MALAILQFVPLALAAITPTMIIFVTVLLAGKDGALKASAVVLGRLTAHLILGIIFLFIVSQLPPDAIKDNWSEGRSLAVLFLLAGILLLLLAVLIFVRGGNAEPDAKPFGRRLERLNPLMLYVANLAIVCVSIRLISLEIAGAAIIEQADVNDVQTWVLLLILCGCLIWPMLVPIGVYAAVGDRRTEVLLSMQGWLTAHQREINTAVLAFFGGVLVAKGYSGI